jgi:hypothetical protein
MGKKTTLPKNLQAVLWSKDATNLNLDEDKNYIIHQVLAYGTWDQIKWLFKTYSANKIRTVFREYPEKDYTNKSFNFAKNILLEISSNLDKRYYVKTFPRVIGQQ